MHVIVHRLENRILCYMLQKSLEYFDGLQILRKMAFMRWNVVTTWFRFVDSPVIPGHFSF